MPFDIRNIILTKIFAYLIIGILSLPIIIIFATLIIGILSLLKYTIVVLK